VIDGNMIPVSCLELPMLPPLRVLVSSFIVVRRVALSWPALSSYKLPAANTR
jgi:hypothetical protein